MRRPARANRVPRSRRNSVVVIQRGTRHTWTKEKRELIQRRDQEICGRDRAADR